MRIRMKDIVEWLFLLLTVMLIVICADHASAQDYVDVERENYEAAARAEQAAIDARNYKEPMQTTKAKTKKKDPIKRVGDFLAEGRNYALEEVRISFVEGLSPGISEGSLSPAMLFTKEQWRCTRHLAFTSIDFDGSMGDDKRTLSFYVERGRIQDSDGFRYSYRNGLEMIGNTRDTKFLRSLRYEYYCDDFPFCDKDNYSGINLIIEESVKGEGALSYLSRYLNGVSGEDAIAALIRNRALAALNRRTWGCESGKWLTGCEMAINYYSCHDGDK